MKKLVIISFLTLLFCFCAWQMRSVFDFVRTARIVAQIQSGGYDDARKQISDMPRETSFVKYLDAHIAYEQGDYETATSQTIGLNDWHSLYLSGNAWYRLGESQSDTQEIAQSWIRAIQSYDQALLLSDESWIGENRDFVRQKLDELTQSQDQSNQESESSQGDESQEGDEGDGQSTQSGGSGGQGSAPRELSESDVQTIEAYIQQLEDEQQELQPYLDRFGTARDQSAFSTLEEYFFGGSGNGEKDW